MRLLLLIVFLISVTYADIKKINTFSAEFVQTVKDEKGALLTYSGKILAKKPQYALWKYKKPVAKSIYISPYRLTVVEPELEQVITRNISSEFNFFDMLKRAKKISSKHYETHIEDTTYHIFLDGDSIVSIQYTDEFDNKVTILFSHQKINKEIDTNLFTPTYPLDYDIINS